MVIEDDVTAAKQILAKGLGDVSPQGFGDNFQDLLGTAQKRYIRTPRMLKSSPPPSPLPLFP